MVKSININKNQESLPYKTLKVCKMPDNESNKNMCIDDIPGDKSISHRVLIFSSLAKGVSTITNLLQSEDTKRTATFFSQLGVIFKQESSSKISVISKGFKDFSLDTKINKNNLSQDISNLKIPASLENSCVETYMGNSGTSCRLLMGLTVGLQLDGTLIFKGDKSLSSRPMLRVIKPLQEMGGNFFHNNGVLPVAVAPSSQLNEYSYIQQEPSAQVKSALLLASLVGGKKLRVTERTLTRDHTENILRVLNVDISKIVKPNETIITLNNNKKDINSYNYVIPKDFSSAAFFIVLALINKNCKMTLTNILLNPLRIGLLKALKLMEANIVVANKKFLLGEEIGDIIVESSNLKGAVIPNILSSSMIDEYPILAVAASMAEGKTTFLGIEELKYKESNRAEILCSELKKLGVSATLNEDTINILGNKDNIKGGHKINSKGDHRIAMSFAILSTVLSNPLTINDSNCIDTSFPEFISILEKLGVKVEEK